MAAYTLLRDRKVKYEPKLNILLNRFIDGYVHNS